MLQREIQELSEDAGRGQYPKGFVKMRQYKSQSFWKFLDENVIGIKDASES